MDQKQSCGRLSKEEQLLLRIYRSLSEKDRQSMSQEILSLLSSRNGLGSESEEFNDNAKTDGHS